MGYHYPIKPPSKPAAPTRPPAPSHQPAASRELEQFLREWISKRKGNLYSGWLRLRILELAEEREGEISTGEAYEELKSEVPGLKVAAVSKMLKKMSEEGLLMRVSFGPRFTFYLLTPRGKTLLERIKRRQEKVRTERQLKSLLLSVLRGAQLARLDVEAGSPHDKVS